MGLFSFFGGGKSAAKVDLSAPLAQLKSPDAKVRLAGCQALGNMGKAGEGAIPQLRELLADDDGDVCTAAAAALSDIERGLPRS
jgi:HEAT repeat protein